VSDLYSRTVLSHIFEALYGWDHLARPAKVVPLTAAAMPEVSADFKVWTIPLRRGIFYPEDAAFKGQRRELQARDYVYAFQRIVDPANISPVEADIEGLGILGLNEARKAALESKKPFDYDKPLPGLRALDSHTLRIELAEPRPRLLYTLAANDLLGGQAREVVEHYGDTIGEHPVGTGPFRLKRWRRSSRIVLERNPAYREVLYDAEPAADDAEGQAILKQFKGRRLPLVDEVDIAIVEEFQPQWLAFLNAEVDGLLYTTGHLPSQFNPVAMPGGKLAPNLVRQGVQAWRSLAPDITVAYFSMVDPVVGGYTPAQVALRRALSLAYDTRQEARRIRKGQAILAQSPVMPHTTGFDPHFKSELSDYDPPRARALLDMYGFVDRDGDGWRERPDGSPLEIEIATEPEQIYREYNELWQKGFKAIGIRTRFDTQQWPEHLKAAEAGKLMFWELGFSGTSPDPLPQLALYYGPQAGNANLARFKLDAFDKLFERAQLLPDGAERNQVLFEAKRLAVAWMPYKPKVHRIHTDMAHAWVHGFRRPLFWNEWWHLVDIDRDRRRAFKP
jgi:ABC-type transport system substrate-binding protein